MAPTQANQQTSKHGYLLVDSADRRAICWFMLLRRPPPTASQWLALADRFLNTDQVETLKGWLTEALQKQIDKASTELEKIKAAGEPDDEAKAAEADAPPPPRKFHRFGGAVPTVKALIVRCLKENPEGVAPQELVNYVVSKREEVSPNIVYAELSRLARPDDPAPVRREGGRTN